MVEVIALGLSLIMCIPVIILSVEIILAAVPGKGIPVVSAGDMSPRIAVLIPAHDEEQGLRATIESVKAQMPSSGRLIVVADNCTDGTASIARSAGAEVTERKESERRGKGYALDWGLQFIKSDPPDVVVVIDADCRLGRGSLATIVGECMAYQRPVQAQYLMRPALNSAGKQKVSAFAWIVKGYVRALGLSKLRLPCHLMGTGMAFPWKAIASVDVANGCLVEDLKLGLELTANGYAPRYCPAAQVESFFASSEEGFLSQRRRWEVGSLKMLGSEVPRYFWRGVARGNVQLAMLSLDAMVPPLSLLITGMGVFWLAALSFLALGYSSVPFIVMTLAQVLTASSLMLAWVMFGRHVLEARDLGHIAGHLAQKALIYRPRTHPVQWIRTDRS